MEDIRGALGRIVMSSGIAEVEKAKPRSISEVVARNAEAGAGENKDGVRGGDGSGAQIAEAGSVARLGFGQWAHRILPPAQIHTWYTSGRCLLPDRYSLEKVTKVAFVPLRQEGTSIVAIIL